MNNKSKKIGQLVGFFFIVILLLSSCKKDWLAVKPDQKLTLPSTLKDFQALMDNSTYLINISSPALGEISSDYHYVTDENYQTKSDQEKNAYTWSKQLPNVNIPDWSLPYSNIAACNVTLDGLIQIATSSAIEVEEKNSIRGQALFHRAKMFFELAQIYSPVYTNKNPTILSGIPLRLSSDINEKTQRSSLEETYNRIIADLQEAQQLLPNSQPYKTRPTKLAANGLLARVYLTMSDYANANKYANLYLSSQNELMNFNNSDEINAGSNTAAIFRFNKEVIFHSRMTIYGIIGNQMRVTKDFLSLFEPNDLRLTTFFGSSAGLPTFKGNYSGQRSLPFTGIATDEIYLIRAETYARLDKMDLALKDLNKLLENRYQTGSFQPITASNSTEALKRILLERTKELYFRGIRWTDLRRLNQVPETATTLTRTIQGTTYTLEPNSFKYVLPIPDDIIQLTGLKQNDGWMP